MSSSPGSAELPRFRAIREKHGVAVPDGDEHLRALTAEGRVLLAMTPGRPPASWTCWGWTGTVRPQDYRVTQRSRAGRAPAAQAEVPAADVIQRMARGSPRLL